MHVQTVLVDKSSGGPDHDCTMYEKCFKFLLNSSFSEKKVFLRKLRENHLSQPTASLTTIAHPPPF